MLVPAFWFKFEDKVSENLLDKQAPSAQVPKGKHYAYAMVKSFGYSNYIVNSSC